MTKEELLNKVATRLMNKWDMYSFKLSNKRLFDVIMESMDEYAGLQIKKLNIDDASNCLHTYVPFADGVEICTKCDECLIGD